ncbi:MAG TPA: hypothetical protein VLJ58_03940 [Ramlibacter sp.]|nr:hypothetical protein [Ramlibacter sp.]
MTERTPASRPLDSGFDPSNPGSSHPRRQRSGAVAGLLLAVALAALALPQALQQWPHAAVPKAQLAAPAAPVAKPVRPAVPHEPRLADFGRQKVSPDARQLANWTAWTGDHQGLSFVIVDKKQARVYLFDPQAHLVAQAPALLGAARGDHTVPGIGDKPLSEVLPQEKTTPAGRFIAEPGTNTRGEDIVWIDYDAAVSMHRVRALVEAERRLQRLASATPRDNRISFGCINLPVDFYEKALSPAVRGGGAVVYVLPETGRPADVFGSWDVTAGGRKLAQRHDPLRS